MASPFRVAVLDDYQQVAAGMAEWSTLPAGVAVNFFHDHIGEPDALVEALEPFDAVVAMRERTPFPRYVLERLPRMQLLITTGMRNAAIDLDAAHGCGIVVCGTRGHPASTGELTWALILALVRGLVDDDRGMRQGYWQRRMAADLEGQSLGVVGLGRQGAWVARIGQAFGMDVAAWSPNLTEQRAVEHGVRYRTRHELFATSRIVSVHMVLGDTTRGLIGEEELSSMRADAFLVNTARAEIVDQQALRAALNGGWIAGAGLDVYDIEPLPDDHWLRTCRRAVLSPHMGYVSERNYRTFYQQACEGIAAFLAGSPVRELTPAAA